MLEWILYSLVVYSLGLITGPLFLFVMFKLAMKLLRKRILPKDLSTKTKY